MSCSSLRREAEFASPQLCLSYIDLKLVMGKQKTQKKTFDLHQTA